MFSVFVNIKDANPTSMYILTLMNMLQYISNSREK